MAARFTLRDLFWMVLVVAIALGWFVQATYVQMVDKARDQEWMNHELKTAQDVTNCADRMEILMIEVSNRSFRRFGPFVTNDTALLQEIHRCLAKPDVLERNSLATRPLSGHCLEITMVCSARKREYRLRLLPGGESIALGDGARIRVVRQDSRIWDEAFRLAEGADSMTWNNDSL